MAVAGVEIEVVIARLAEERQVGGRHRPQARPHFSPLVVGPVGIKLRRHPLHEGEVGRLVAGVVAGEFSCGGDPQPVAEARDGDQIVLVDAAERRRRLVVADGNCQRIALDRIDRQLEPDGARNIRAVAAECQDIGVAPHRACIGPYRLDRVAACLDRRHRRSRADLAALRKDPCGKRTREQRRVAGLVGRAIDRPRDLVPGRRQRGVEPDDAVAVEHLDQPARRIPGASYARRRGPALLATGGSRGCRRCCDRSRCLPRRRPRSSTDCE